MIQSQDFPKEITRAAPSSATYPFWWVRGIVLDVQEVERPANDDKLKHLRDTLIKIGDVDNPDDGYDVRIEGNWHSIEPNDAVSLLGHEPADAGRVSFPRLFINHHTSDYRRAYPPASRLPYGVLPIVEWKYWLAGKLPANTQTKWINGVILLGALLLPYFVVGNVLGPPIAIGLAFAVLVIATPFIIATVLLGLYLRWLVSQPRFTWESKAPLPLWAKNIADYLNHSRQDLTSVYELTAKELVKWAHKNPDPGKDWVPVQRGAHTVGLLHKSSKPDNAIAAGAAPAIVGVPFGSGRIVDSLLEGNHPSTLPAPQAAPPNTPKPIDPKTETYKNKYDLGD